ncbi:peptide chain release factor N(5)-glutamine methyltransferase [[Bacteroides] pectinophilus]|jgi:release factor glutamine methyltransferase|uniref:Release factor glutamine methyltransferase n=1 Tax=[Bacteroides] pectinophilus ATCC 43243 TaxID=483218 RepID=B7ARB7_9FIRM|nr:protein-(glutamine-N5) methyltransferase, release factor-specific [[Bacteroides] pectinophilus ATCC 43243]UWN96566.1 peptide chain release factor N(5)-glutamine methyltransferase [[Bacteroides] pectinophilus]
MTDSTAPKLTYRQMCHNGAAILADAGITDAEYDSFALLEYITGMDRTAYILNGSKSVPEDIAERYDAVIDRRSSHIPLQHITGQAWFYGRGFNVNSDVLVPRQDTEVLVSEALKVINAKDSVLDMCTGSGCIIITLALEKKLGRALGADISEAALKVASGNREKLGADDVTFVKSNIFSDINVNDDELFDVIVSNPPYIATGEIETLTEEVRIHDPYIALDGLEDGLHFYREITQQSMNYIKSGGWLLYEIGCTQAHDVSDIMSEYGYSNIKVIKDLAGLDRVVMGQRL